MPRNDPQAVFVDPNGNPFGAVYGLPSPGDGMASEKFRTEKAPVADVKAHGAKGDGSNNDTTAIKNAISAADANDETVYFPPGTYLLNDSLTIPPGVRVLGAGRDNTTIRSTNNNAQITFHLESHAGLKGFTLDQNIQNRTYNKSTGVMISGGKNHCVIEDVAIDNLSTGGEGVGIYLDVNESDPQDTYFNRISNVHVEGGWQNGSNSGDFLIRGRTAFNSDLTDDQFTTFLRHNLIEGCTFTGEGKAAIEWVGPATRHNLSIGNVARDFTTCTGIFESSLGAKHNTFAFDNIYNCYGDSTCIGFYSDGYQSTGVPDRYSEDDLFIGCRVRNFRQLKDGSDIRAFRIRRGDRVKLESCFVDGVSVPAGSLGTGIGVDVNYATDARLNSMTIQNVDQRVTAANNTRPRWNNVIGGGPFGGVALSTTTAPAGTRAMSDGTSGTSDTANLYATRTGGGSWRLSDGTLI